MTAPTKPNAWIEFRLEFSRCWSALPDKAYFFGLLALWLALFEVLGNSTLGYVHTPSLFRWLVFIYQTVPDDEHGAIIPFVVLILFWQQRNELLAAPKANWWPALVLLAGAVAAHVLAFTVQQPKGSTIAFFTGLYALMGLVWGPAWLRASFFPFVLFVFCVPLGSIASDITFGLRMLVTRMAVGISNGLLGLHVIRDGSRIFDSHYTFQYEVAPACSGIRSLISLGALAICYAFVFFRSWWKRLLLISACVPLAIAGNVLRLLMVIMVANAWGQSAGAKVETNLGFFTFSIAGAGLLVIGRVIREPRAKTKGEGV